MFFCIVDHMCGPVRSSPGGRVEKIVLAGGFDGGQGDSDTVVYDISGNIWTTGKIGTLL